MVTLLAAGASSRRGPVRATVAAGAGLGYIAGLTNSQCLKSHCVSHPSPVLGEGPGVRALTVKLITKLRYRCRRAALAPTAKPVEAILKGIALDNGDDAEE